MAGGLFLVCVLYFLTREERRSPPIWTTIAEKAAASLVSVAEIDATGT